MAKTSIIRLLAVRLLTGKKRNRFLSFISGVSLFGVCLGVAALTVVMGVMEGFETKLRSIITGTHSHIVLYSARQVIPNQYEFESRLRALLGDDVTALSPYVFSEVMLAKGSRVTGAMLEGVEAESLKLATNVSEYLVEGAMPDRGESPGILLGANVAETLSAKVGDSVSVITPFFEKDTLQPRAKKFRVSGILSTGMYEYDSKYSMVHADEAKKFFQLPLGAASAFKLKTGDANASTRVAAKIQKELGFPYRARDWTELNKNLLYAIKLQKSVIFVILTAIIVVAAFNIMSTLMMMMSEKKKEMSILKAMGLSARQSSSVFIVVGMIIGAAGAVAGVSLGLLLCLVLAKTQLIRLPSDIYFISYLPVDVRPATLVLIGVCALSVALLATLYPSYRIAVESPVEGLRYE